MRADLHLHTYYSDGQFSPAEIVGRAKACGLQLIAVTDHDTALASEEVKELCKDEGLKSVNGIEVSAYDGDVKIHILGYNIDINCADYKNFSEKLYKGSFTRAEDIIFKLNKMGVKIDMREVLAERKCSLSPVHAMYIARAASEKGYAQTPFKFYTEYMNTGKGAYSNLCRPDPETAVEFIHACGGIASLAHPDRIELSKDGVKELIKRLKGVNLDGIEAVYSTHTAIKTAYYKETAKAFNLLVTGGSDAHYPSGSKKIGTPFFEADTQLLKSLKI